ncbi:MAG: Mrp/NBP35 family ATP-binding protein [Alphaproteobacteria bacterium GM7ARS4]|nr:Mrp/NBP35 family ATP-binding protein [Alphaproteobacteria bacterium GM7ARS4]
MVTPQEKQDIATAIGSVCQSCGGVPFFEEMVQHVQKGDDGRTHVIINIGHRDHRTYDSVVKALMAQNIMVVLTAEKTPSQAHTHERTHERHERMREGRMREQSSFTKILMPDVRYRLAITCAKGGVGKSTTAVHTALALARQNKRVALLDADIYGPSVPMMMGLQGQLSKDANGKIVPLYRHGIACMSIGLMLANKQEALIWRGPMVMRALQQMLRDVAWGSLDVMVIDMPPGTGDVQLTLAQRFDVTGAVIVSTPQDVALYDAMKGYHMLTRVGIPVFGFINNMCSFICPHCHKESLLFGENVMREKAAALGLDVLAEIPFRMALREASDSGTPLIISDPDGVEAQIYGRLAKALLMRLAAESSPS